MEPKMNFYYPGEQEVDDSPNSSGDAEETTASSFPKPKTRKEYFLAYFLNKLNTILPETFNALPIPRMSYKDRTDDLRYAWLVRKFVSPRPFEFSDQANVYVLLIEPFKLATEYGIDAKSIADFENNHNRIIDDKYYEVIIDNTYSCEVSPSAEEAVLCGPYEIFPDGRKSFYITSKTEPTHIPVVDVYIHYVIYKQPKSTLEYYIAKAATCPLLNTDNPPEPKTTEEIYWAYVCKEQEGSGGSGSDSDETP